MQTFKSYFSFKIGLLVFAGVFSIVSGVLALAPRNTNTAKSENCSGAPTVATLNPFPVSWAGTTGIDCTDAPAIAIRPVSSPTGSYSSSANAQGGEEFYIRLYVHNGAQQGLDENKTTAYDVQGGIAISGNKVSTDFDGVRYDGSLTNTVYGSVSVNMPQGAHLELIPGSQEFFDYQGNFKANGGTASLGTTSGTFNLGDMKACFEYSMLIRFRIKVVAPAVQSSLTLTTDKSEYCVGSLPFYTIKGSPDLAGKEIKWSSTLNGQSTGEFYAGYGHFLDSQSNWSGFGNAWNTNQIGSWTKTAHVSGLSQTVSFNVKNCAGPAPTVDYQLTINKPEFCVGETPQYTIAGNAAAANKKILWSSFKNNVSTGEVDVDYGHRTNSAGHWQDWGSIWNSTHIGSWRKEANIDGVRKSVSFTVKDCSTPKIDYTFYMPYTDFCVGAAPQYVITADKSSVGKKILWSSYKNGVSTGEVDADYGFYLTLRDNQAMWNEWGSTWTSNDIGSWRKEANIDGVRKSVSFTVKDCAQPVPLIFCSPSNQTVEINQTASLSASGGSGSYSWSAVNGSPSTGAGTNFATKYSVSGFKTVNVSSNGKTASCSVEVKQPVTPSGITSLVKEVRNLSSGGSFADSTTAKKGETVEYRITVKALTSTNLQNVRVTDTWNASLSYLDGSLKVDGVAHAPGLSTGGLVFESISQTAKVITYQATVQADSGTLVNTAQATANNAGSVSDQAQVIVVFVPTGQPNLTILKEVKNLTDNGNFAKTAQASRNETVQYRITVRNTGTLDANDPTISDNFNTGGITLNNDLNVSKSYTGSSLSTGITLGVLKAGDSLTITFSGVVNIDNGTITNTAMAIAKNASTVSDVANVFVSTAPPGQANLSIDKTVRNLTTGNTGFTNSASAQNGQTLEFKLVITNTGNATAESARVSDLVPSGLSFISGSVGSPDGAFTSDNLNSTQGLLIGNMLIGQSVTIYFRATANQTSGTLVNTARTWANNVSEKIDQASVEIISQAQGSLSVNKQVRNLTSGTSFAKSVSAESGNRVAYQIIVTANTQNIQNVLVVENVPANLSYINGSARLDGQTVSDNLFNTGLNLGTLSAGQPKTLSFEAFVYAQGGLSQTVIINTASASGSSVATVSDSATVYVNQNIGGGFSQLSVNKSVKRLNEGYYQNSVNVNSGETVSFEITVNNTGSQNLNNVRIQDSLPSGLNLLSGSVRVDGNYSGNSLNDIYLGSLGIGQQKRVNFDATASLGGNSSIQNIARAFADNVSQVQDDAWVFISQVAGGNVNLSFSKRAFNDTKNVDATAVTATREDFITYTLTVTNNGNAPASSFVVTDDLSQVLSYADLVDNGGGILSGNVISYPAVTVPAGGSVQKSFRVRVKFQLAANLAYTMSNTYGNTVTVRINTPQVLGEFVAPKTGGPSVALASVFGSLLTGGMAIIRYRKKVWELIWE